MTSKTPLIIPVENQVRELDPKLLLACVAANRGFVSIIGFRREIHFHIARFPGGVYLSKSMTDASDSIFRIMHKLGYQVAAWDEEALVHLPPEIYYSRRLSPVAVKMVAHFFAWGQDSAELWRNYPHFPPDTPIHVTGNPRCDLLRPDIRPYYTAEVRKMGTDRRTRVGGRRSAADWHASPAGTPPGREAAGAARRGCAAASRVGSAG